MNSLPAKSRANGHNLLDAQGRTGGECPKGIKSMADNAEHISPPTKLSTKHHLWRLGAYLTPFVYAAVLILWPHSLPAWLVILAGILVLSLFVTAGLLHIRDLGGWTRMEAYIHSHLLPSIAAIVILCCLIFGTGAYLMFRPSRMANTQVAKAGVPRDDPQDKPAPPPPQTIQPAPTTKPTEKAKLKTPKEPAPQTPQPQAQPQPQPQTPPQQPTTQPTYQQQCKDSACAQGTGATATYNQYGVKKQPPTIVSLKATPFPAVPATPIPQTWQR
jgi:hypothetical protein